ncbi:uncharacterized protein LOC128986082 [Macrosteles quadrilineatus]|uniref:uncharacterized protein LOC128986082 n=1 Tax=Macrosteles quadrilineatus TaxID=74068 RepID=UPI0023E0EA68|nr:uncharacterized protein LOC128986082 [Macrosteles quadrilineatus]
MNASSRNIEIKAKVRNVEELIAKAKQLSASEGTILNQHDIFFHTTNPLNRLKLREENGTGTLISYSRPDVEGPKLSEYVKCNVSDVPGLTSVLADALGKKGSVKKQRFLYLVGQTRIHIDRVEELGDFMELEVMLKEGQSAEEGEAIAANLMTQLGVSESDLLSGAYMDVLPKSS